MDIPLRFNIGAELIERNLGAGPRRRPRDLVRREDPQLPGCRRADGFALAGALLRAGVEPEQRVLFILPASP